MKELKRSTGKKKPETQLMQNKSEKKKLLNQMGQIKNTKKW